MHFFPLNQRTFSRSYLLVCELLARVGLLWVVEPVDPNHHVATPWLPHALDAADEGQVGPARWQEDGAVADADHLPAPDDGLVEELLGLALHTAPLHRGVEVSFFKWSLLLHNSNRNGYSDKTNPNPYLKFFLLNSSNHFWRCTNKKKKEKITNKNVQGKKWPSYPNIFTL